jgi:hypothetical protein
MCTAAEIVVTGILAVSFQVAHLTHGSHKFQPWLLAISTQEGVTCSDVISPFHRSQGLTLSLVDHHQSLVESFNSGGRYLVEERQTSNLKIMVRGFL